jgi:hypothetical protein
MNPSIVDPFLAQVNEKLTLGSENFCAKAEVYTTNRMFERDVRATVKKLLLMN